MLLALLAKLLFEFNYALHYSAAERNGPNLCILATCQSCNSTFQRDVMVTVVT